MSRRTVAWIAWAVALGVTATTVFALIVSLQRGEFVGGSVAILSGLLWTLIPAVFALLAALIVSNQPHNVVGWVLMTPGAGTALAALIGFRFTSIETAPTRLDPGLFIALWVDSWSWLLLIFPIFHLLQVFPTGRILTRRWRWLTGLEILMFSLMIGFAAFAHEIGPLEGAWSVENPIGFLPADFFDQGFTIVWTIGLLILTIGGATSTIVRYRRGLAGEREQIKWLLYAMALFAVVYSVTALLEGFESGGVWDLLLGLSIVSIPVAITVAVLRYRLYDIDLIIRRTLVYGMLTGLLTAVYLGSVVILQGLLGAGRDSSVGVAASTLLITALFTPLRRRIQVLIDRRLYRNKYNAQLVIERFGSAAQNQANLERLSADLLAVVEQTIQPRFGDLWIRERT